MAHSSSVSMQFYCPFRLIMNLWLSERDFFFLEIADDICLWWCCSNGILISGSITLPCLVRLRENFRKSTRPIQVQCFSRFVYLLVITLYFSFLCQYRLRTWWSCILLYKFLCLVLSDSSKRTMYDAGLYDLIDEVDEVGWYVVLFK